MATKKVESNDLILQTYTRVCAIEKILSAFFGQLEKEKTIYLAAAGPDLALSVIRQEDVFDHLSCFDESDAIYNLPDSDIMMSYCPAEMIHLPGKRYLTGTVVFFKLDDDDYDIKSLGLEDICKITEFLSEHDTALMADGVSFNGICLD